MPCSSPCNGHRREQALVQQATAATCTVVPVVAACPGGIRSGRHYTPDAALNHFEGS